MRDMYKIKRRHLYNISLQETAQITARIINSVTFISRHHFIRYQITIVQSRGTSHVVEVTWYNSRDNKQQIRGRISLSCLGINVTNIYLQKLKQIFSEIISTISFISLWKRNVSDQRLFNGSTSLIIIILSWQCD